jgi:hypothetical protein
MREARHYGRGVRALLGEAALITGERLVDRVDRGLIQSRKSVATWSLRERAVCSRRRPDQLGEPALYVHMDVFRRA